MANCRTGPDHPLNDISYLNTAAILKRDEIFRIIADTGKVDITAKDPHDDGMTPLHRACVSGCVEIVDFLLAQDSVKATVDERDENDRTPLSHAVEKGHEEIVQRLLNLSTVNPDAIDNRDHTPFYYAINYGHQNIARALLDTGRISRRDAARVVAERLADGGSVPTLI